jgi:hypothetical protein
MKDKSQKYCPGCPMTTGQVCSLAVDAVYSASQNKSKRPPENSCEWFVNSEEYNYCFWILNKELDGNPLTDREICHLLCITQEELSATYNSAIEKLKKNKDNPDVKEFLESIIELSLKNNVDNTTYMPNNFRDKIEEDDKPEEPAPKKAGRPKMKRGLGMPVHRDGRKIDLWGLSKRKK